MLAFGRHRPLLEAERDGDEDRGDDDRREKRTGRVEGHS